MRALTMLLALTTLFATCVSPPSTQLYPHPWPDERLREADGTVSATSFPRGNGAPVRDSAVRALRGARGFGTSSAIFFPFDAPLDPTSLPSLEESVSRASSVLVIDVDRSSPSFGERAWIDVQFLPDGGPFGGTNLLVALPYPGMPLAPDTLHAAIVTTRVHDALGEPLPALFSDDDALARGLATEAHVEALDVLDALDVDRASIASWAVFRTDDPTRVFREGVAQALREEPSEITAPELVEQHEDYCVFRASIDMPVYQEGSPPFDQGGGGWVFDDDGALVRQTYERSRVWITVPRVSVSDEATHPSAVFVRAGGGGDRPLVDRGPRDREGVSPPGTGIARELAQAGYVGLSVDGPLGGARNLAGWDEQTAIFNVLNPAALRDNVRQSALELVLFAHAIDSLVIDASACEGAASSVRVDPRPVLIGHSTGATIAPLAAAVEPRYAALVLSGAGGSWIRQIVHKQSPVELRPMAEILLEYWPSRTLVEHDPALSLLEWAGEPADPLVYEEAIRDRPVLVFQGILDTYIPPPISNPTALALGVAREADALDEALPYRCLDDDLALLDPTLDRSGRRIVQLPADGIEDGHEVMFQRDDARAILREQLEALAARRAP